MRRKQKNRAEKQFSGKYQGTLVLCLLCSLLLAGCDEYSEEEMQASAGGEEERYILDLADEKEEYPDSVRVEGNIDSAGEFGNGSLDGGRDTSLRSVWRDSTGERYGSSGRLEGRIAVVTILTNDTVSTWKLGEEQDFKRYSRVYNNLKIGCSWISQACQEYGREVEFVWDWVEHKELIYRTTLNREIASDYAGAYKDMQSYVGNCVDSDRIKKDLDANGIIYMVCVDTPSTNTTASSTFSWKRNSPCEDEMCFMLMDYKGQINAPATFAHEILHTFGAPDLYYAGKNGISQDYVDYAKASGTNDIMRVTWNLDSNYYVYDRVCNEITDITAYYLGLTDYSQTVEEWGLGESDYAYFGEDTGTGIGTSAPEEAGWWNMLDSTWEKSDWEYQDGEWVIWDEETQYYYIYVEDEDLFLAVDLENNGFMFQKDSCEWEVWEDAR